MCYPFAVEQQRNQVEAAKAAPFRAGRASWWLLALYSIFLLTTTSYISIHRHFWFDEIDTFFIGTLPNLKTIWNALLLAGDGQPIGFYVPVHLCYLIFGASEISLRLCAVIPFWLTTLVLYYAVARRTSPFYGLIAALAPTCTVAFQYSFEARPYALVLLFSACSFVAWQFAKEGRKRILSVPAVAVTLAAAISVHYNALLIVIPIVIGELVYTVRNRYIDWAIVIAVCASALPILFLLPHIQAIHVYSKSYWSQTNFSTLSSIYYSLSPQFVVLAILGCAAISVWIGLSVKQHHTIIAAFGGLPAHELAAAGSYLILPVACFVLSFYTKALHYRYVIATVIGFSLSIPFILWIFRSIFSRVARVLPVLLVMNLLHISLSRIRRPDEDSWGTFASYAELFDPATRNIYQSTQALVLGDGPFLEIAKYGTVDLRERSFYVLDKAHPTNSSIVFRGLRNGIKGPFHLTELTEFKRAHRSFLMYNPEPWLLERLLAEDNAIIIRANLPHGFLYEVAIRR